MPVLEIGPFDVEPGPVRSMWMEMFHNVSLFAVVVVGLLPAASTDCASQILLLLVVA